ncbi:MAG: hypothetical protein QM811_19590 [Pirellulales bacterium]
MRKVVGVPRRICVIVGPNPVRPTDARRIVLVRRRKGVIATTVAATPAADLRAPPKAVVRRSARAASGSAPHKVVRNSVLGSAVVRAAIARTSAVANRNAVTWRTLATAIVRRTVPSVRVMAKTATCATATARRRAVRIDDTNRSDYLTMHPLDVRTSSGFFMRSSLRNR